MPTVVMPKNPRTYDYFIGSLAYIANSAAGATHPDESILFETENLPPNTKSKEVKDYLHKAFTPEAKRIAHMHYKHNICDPIICSNKSVQEKIEEIAAGLMKHKEFRLVTNSI